MSRRSPEQVHDEDGHGEFVASCGRCQTEAEADRNAEQARAELADGEVVGEQGPEAVAFVEDGEIRIAGHEGPLPEVDPASGRQVPAGVDVIRPLEDIDGPSELDPASALTATSRPKCRLKRCPLPEFTDDAGLCGGHWSTRADLRKEARRA